ncbi:MAG: hypothetical protein AAF409_08080 [Pseudomonadota bacterium]
MVYRLCCLLAVLLLTGCSQTFEQQVAANPFKTGDARALVLVGIVSSDARGAPVQNRISWSGSPNGALRQLIFADMDMLPGGAVGFHYFFANPGPLSLSGFAMGPDRTTMAGGFMVNGMWVPNTVTVREWLVRFRRSQTGRPALDARFNTPLHQVEAGAVNYVGTYTIQPSGQPRHWSVIFENYAYGDAWKPPPRLPHAPHLVAVDVDEEAARAFVEASGYGAFPYRIAKPNAHLE